MKQLVLGVVAALGVLLLGAGPARAHQGTVVYLDVVPRGRTVETTLQIAHRDLGPLLRPTASDAERERAATRDEVEAGQGTLAAAIAAGIHVTADGAACDPGAARLGFRDTADGFFAVVTTPFRCPRTGAHVVVRDDLFFDLDPRHEAMVRLFARPDDPTPAQEPLRGARREVSLDRPVSLGQHLLDFVRLGLEHIFTGYDHLAFVFGLLAGVAFVPLGAGLKRVLAVITAFTAAHSLTLALAGLGLVRLSPRWVEPAIALSIAVIAVENLWREAGRRRWLVAFAFGLVHGFGFASVLGEVGLPRGALVLSLLAFNIGVELGQLAVVLLLAPALALLARPMTGTSRAAVCTLSAACATLLVRSGLSPIPVAVVFAAATLAALLLVPRYGAPAVLRRGGSVALAAFALYWFAERVANTTWLHGALG